MTEELHPALKKLFGAMETLRNTTFRAGADTRLDGSGLPENLVRQLARKKILTLEALGSADIRQIADLHGRDLIREAELERLVSHVSDSIETWKEKGSKKGGGRKSGQSSEDMTWNRAISRLGYQLRNLNADLARYPEMNAALTDLDPFDLTGHAGLKAALRNQNARTFDGLRSLPVRVLEKAGQEHGFGPDDVEAFRSRLEARIKPHIPD